MQFNFGQLLIKTTALIGEQPFGILIYVGTTLFFACRENERPTYRRL